MKSLTSLALSKTLIHYPFFQLIKEQFVIDILLKRYPQMINHLINLINNYQNQTSAIQIYDEFIKFIDKKHQKRVIQILKYKFRVFVPQLIQIQKIYPFINKSKIRPKRFTIIQPDLELFEGEINPILAENFSKDDLILIIDNPNISENLYFINEILNLNYPKTIYGIIKHDFSSFDTTNQYKFPSGLISNIQITGENIEELQLVIKTSSCNIPERPDIVLETLRNCATWSFQKHKTILNPFSNSLIFNSKDCLVVIAKGGNNLKIRFNQGIIPTYLEEDYETNGKEINGKRYYYRYGQLVSEEDLAKFDIEASQLIRRINGGCEISHRLIYPLWFILQVITLIFVIGLGLYLIYST